jgi:hypothetical protein
MAGERYVVLGLARPRAEWFRSVGRWATGAALPAEFLKCLSVEELRARLGGGRPCSAALLDGGLPAVDRDLLLAVREAGAVVLVVDDRAQRRDWLALGAAAVLPSTFGREGLLDALATHAPLVGLAAPADPGALPSADAGVIPGSSLVATVCGPGGTGASTVAAALSQGLAADAYGEAGVLLADLARNAEQAMLHDVRDVVPGVQELVEAHRSGRPARHQVEALTFHVVDRGYHLLLGLRRARFWSTLRPAAFEAAFDSLRQTFGVVVCDVTADFEGDDAGGSIDVEERNLMARTAAGCADVVFAVGRPGVKGLHSLVRVLADLAELGVAPGRIVPVVNAAPRHPRGRAELAAALADVAGPALGGEHTAAPVFLPSRRVEEALRDAVRLPAPLAPVLTGAFRATVERTGPVSRRSPEPVPVVPGSLGSWTAVEGAS